MAEKKEEKKEYKQPNFFVRIWRETVGELRKVSWPTLQEARRLTIIVIITMIGTGFVLGLLDFLFSLLIHKLIVG
ncbi:MAG: preprotein translocase subunit SecE [Anaerolineae bacterium]|nr:preprotein translocase subunit SecE [Anaerolineae bacterium]